MGGRPSTSGGRYEQEFSVSLHSVYLVILSHILKNVGISTLNPNLYIHVAHVQGHFEKKVKVTQKCKRSQFQNFCHTLSSPFHQCFSEIDTTEHTHPLILRKKVTRGHILKGEGHSVHVPYPRRKFLLQ
jgi:hypothetical protein